MSPWSFDFESKEPYDPFYLHSCRSHGAISLGGTLGKAQSCGDQTGIIFMRCCWGREDAPQDVRLLFSKKVLFFMLFYLYFLFWRCEAS